MATTQIDAEELPHATTVVLPPEGSVDYLNTKVVFNLQDICVYLGVSPRRINRMVENGLLPTPVRAAPRAGAPFWIREEIEERFREHSARQNR